MRSSIWQLWCHTFPGPVRCCGCSACTICQQRTVSAPGQFCGSVARVWAATVTRRPGSGRSATSQGPGSCSRRADGLRELVELTPDSGEPAWSSSDLVHECADGACSRAIDIHVTRKNPAKGANRPNRSVCLDRGTE